MTSVAVFIDYENTRFGAREVFGDPRRDPYTFGHVKPLRLAVLLKQLGEKVDPARELTAVYGPSLSQVRGQPRRCATILAASVTAANPCSMVASMSRVARSAECARIIAAPPTT